MRWVWALLLLVSCQFEGGLKITHFLKNEIKPSCLRALLGEEFPGTRIVEDQRDLVATYKVVYPGKLLPDWITSGAIYHAGARTITLGYNVSAKRLKELPEEQKTKLRSTLAPITVLYDDMAPKLSERCGAQIVENKTGRICSRGSCRSDHR